jgi:hypothetical protein
VERILRQVQLIGTISFTALLRANYRETNKLELHEILETLEGMGVVKLDTTIDSFTGGKRITNITWKGEEKANNECNPSTIITQ